MKKLLVVSDIHGCYNELVHLLKEVNYNRDEHQLIVIGDMINRGPDGYKVLKLMKNLQENDGAIIIRGNHESMMLNYLKYNDNMFLMHGGVETALSICEDDLEIVSPEELQNWTVDMFNDRYKNHILEYYDDIINFVDNLRYYYETDDFLFVHSGIDPVYGVRWKEMSQEDLLWLSKGEFIDQNIEDIGKTIIFGHVPTMNMGVEGIWYDHDNNRICVDGGYIFGGVMSMLEIENIDGEYKYKEYRYKGL